MGPDDVKKPVRGEDVEEELDDLRIRGANSGDHIVRPRKESTKSYFAPSLTRH